MLEQVSCSRRDASTDAVIHTITCPTTVHHSRWAKEKETIEFMAVGARKSLNYTLKTGKRWLSENVNGVQEGGRVCFSKSCLDSVSLLFIDCFVHFFIHFFLLFINYYLNIEHTISVVLLEDIKKDLNKCINILCSLLERHNTVDCWITRI